MAAPRSLSPPCDVGPKGEEGRGRGEEEGGKGGEEGEKGGRGDEEEREMEGGRVVKGEGKGKGKGGKVMGNEAKN